jgi:hypothetical protein
MALSALAIKTAKGTEKPFKLADSDGLYTRGEYWEERIQMMQRWSDYLDQWRDGATIPKGSFGKR